MKQLRTFLLLAYMGCGDKTEPPQQAQTKTKPESQAKEETQDPAATGTPKQSTGSATSAQEDVKRYVAAGAESIPALKETLLSDTAIVQKGWAISALAQIDDPKALALLEELEKDESQKKLIRTWAAAGIVAHTRSLEELKARIELLGTYPSLKRPLQKRLLALEGAFSVGDALLFSIENPKSKALMEAIILEGSPEELTQLMLTHKDQTIRRTSAGYLATIGTNKRDILPTVLAGYDFKPGSKKVRWEGGPLYVPSVDWDRENGRALFEHLVSWYIFCDRKSLDQEKQKLFNNMMSVSLLRVIGMQRFQNSADDLLYKYGQAVGKQKLTLLMKEQRATERYRRILDKL